MAYKYVEYSYPVTHNFEKHIVYANQNCKIYFAMKKEYESSWVYFAGNGTNTLNAGKKLTQYTSETDAQTYYLNAVRDSDSKILVILPAVFQAKFVRLYVESGQSTTVYEWIPSTRLVAHEIISGTLDLTDELSSAPLIRVTKSSVDRLKVGNFTGSTYGIVGFDSSSATIFELSDARRNIGGWDFNASQFTKNNVIISSSGRVRLGSGNDTAQLDSVHPTYRLWIGNASPTAAPFKVTKAGKMFASGVDISGTLAASSITAREIAFRTVTHNNIVMNTLTATEFSASCITANMIRGGDFGTLTLESGKIIINATSGLEINTPNALVVKTGGSMKVQDGGDIVLVGSDINPAALLWKGTIKDVTMGANVTGLTFAIAPNTATTYNTTLSVGFTPSGALRPFDHIQTLARRDTRIRAYGGSNAEVMVTASFFSAGATAKLAAGAGYECKLYGTGKLEISALSNLLQGTNRYLNFNASHGANGYGFRDNAGQMEVKDSGGAWTDITGLSDIKFKKNIEPSNIGLNFISKLEPKQFLWKDKQKNYSNHKFEGLIAQDVKKVLDDLGLNFGGWIEYENGTQILKYNSFIMPIINAIKELKYRLEELEERLK